MFVYELMLEGTKDMGAKDDVEHILKQIFVEAAENHIGRAFGQQRADSEASRPLIPK